MPVGHSLDPPGEASAAAFRAGAGTNTLEAMAPRLVAEPQGVVCELLQASRAFLQLGGLAPVFVLGGTDDARVPSHGASAAASRAMP